MPRGTNVTDRQRGRASYMRELGEAAVLEAIEKRKRLQRRVERRALEYQVLVEAAELEKELEARRCKLCDLLRSEAWGLGHANWMERRCGRCWVQQADALAKQRHSLVHVPAASRSPRPASGGARGPTHMAGASGDSEGDALFGAVPTDRIDAVIKALQARDPDRVMQLLDARALERHFGAQLAPPPEQPFDGYYYHDAVLDQLDQLEQQRALGAVRPPAGPGGENEEGEGEDPGARGRDCGREASSSVSPDTARRGGPPRGRHGSPANDQTNPRASDDDDGGVEPSARGKDGDTLPRDGAIWLEQQQQQQQQRELMQDGGAQRRTPQHTSAGLLGGRGDAGAGPSLPEPLDQVQQQRQQQQAGMRGRYRGEARRVPGVKGLNFRPEQRPLPSKARSVPSDEAELEATLKDVERLVVFGRTQHERSEALFYSHQLRSALGDLRLLSRKGRKAEAVHRQGVRLDTRDELGVARIIREGRRERAPSPTTLRRILQPETFYDDPPRWLEHVHPDRPNPAKVIDVVAWKPPSYKEPPARHTPGMRSAGDWSEYRYDWDLAQIRSMKVNHYLTIVRKEREYRSVLAELQARAHVLGGLGSEGPAVSAANRPTSAPGAGPQA